MQKLLQACDSPGTAKIRGRKRCASKYFLACRAAFVWGLAESHATTPPVSTEGFEKCLVGHYVGYRTKPKVSHL